MGRAATALVAAVVGGTLLCVGGLALFAGAAAGCVPDTASSSVAASGPADTAPADLAGRYDRDQLANAATIVSVGIGRGIPARGLVIAVATALQESALRNLGTATDHDSLGLFQQRPSQGWGSPAQLLDPVYAANAFYTKLLTVPNWQWLPLTDAAQAVQRSAYPGAYAKWEPDATALVALSTGPTRDCTSGDGTSGDGPPGAGVSLPAGFTLPPNTPLPVTIAIWWALRQLGTPYSFGGDCTDPHSGNPAHQCDCSSLVQQAYRAAGISLPRVTGDQQHAGAAVVSLTDAQPGDLLFMPGSDGTPSDPGHVGLYLGQGLLIHAPHPGAVVTVEKASDWADQIAAIRRVVKAD
jgi:cell wall-associated NlpC family hydrolase